jgi:hypothetical protein
MEIIKMTKKVGVFLFFLLPFSRNSLILQSLSADVAASDGKIE